MSYPFLIVLCDVFRGKIPSNKNKKIHLFFYHYRGAKNIMHILTYNL